MFFKSCGSCLYHVDTEIALCPDEKALLSGKHVLCETPEALTRLQCEKLHCIAKKMH